MTDPRIAKMNPGSKGHPRSCMFYLFLLCLLIGCAAFGQTSMVRDADIDKLKITPITPCKTDTITVPIYHFQAHDTVAMVFVLKSSTRIHNGYVIYSGFKVQTNKGMQWSAEPVASGFLDRRKRRFDGKKVVKAF